MASLLATDPDVISILVLQDFTQSEGMDVTFDDSETRSNSLPDSPVRPATEGTAPRERSG